MDQSLDDYISKKQRQGPKFSNDVRARLGGKTSPGKAALQGAKGRQPWVNKSPNVTGPGRMKGFDARHKLAAKQPRDARDLLHTKKVTDARVRLESKKMQQQKQQSSTSKNLPVNDMRIRINNALAKKVDARGKIKSRQDAKNQNPAMFGSAGGVNATRVTVAGNKRILHSGPTPSNVVSDGTGTIFKTVPNTRPRDGVSYSSEATNLSILRGQSKQVLPKVQIKNDRYQAKEIQPVLIQNDYYSPQPVQLQHEYYKPEPRHVDKDHYQQPTMQVEEDLFQSAFHRQPGVIGGKHHSSQAIPTLVGQAPASTPTSGHLHPVVQRGQQFTDVDDVVSPLQGFRVVITNLHPVVTQDDIVELFGAVGALKKARLVKVGIAEVVYVNKEDALAAVRKYHMRELDGQPMQAVLKTGGGVTARLAAQPHRSSGSNGSGPGPLEGIVDHSLLHKALFRTNTRGEQGTGPVSFTVKI